MAAHEHPEPITLMLHRAHEGDEQAFEQAIEIMHSDLIRIANNLMFGKYGKAMYGKTLEPSAVVNEAFLAIRHQRNPFKNRRHFYAIALRVMDRVLKDYDKMRGRKKRGGDRIRVSLSEIGQADEGSPEIDLATLGLLFEKLSAEDGRSGRVAKLRILWGLELAEIADVLQVSRSTVDRDWRFGRRWLRAQLAEPD